MPKKVLIVGGVAGGASAAARLRRLDEQAEIIILERGTEISYANCGLPYYIGGVIENRGRLLLQTPESFYRRFRIEVRTQNEVLAVDRVAKEITVKDLDRDAVYRESFDYLVLTPGARPIRPPLPGIDLPNIFSLRTVPDSDLIRRFVQEFRPIRALVVGGGYIGLEMVENLVHLGMNVTVVDLADQLLAPLDPEMAAIVQRHLQREGIEVQLGRRVVAFEGDTAARRVRFEDGSQLDTDLILLGIGVTPETELARSAGLQLGVSGGILVNEHMQTSDPSIYAAGDAVQVTHFVTGEEVLIPLAGPANKQGRIAADNIAGRTSQYRGTQGTAIAQVLGLVVAVTGANEKMLRKINRPARACYYHPNSHAEYYPGAEEMSVKLIFEPEQGRILGAQIIGRGGVDKRIDVLATAIRAGMSVWDLQELELSYAPPFSSAKDPVNIGGYIAGNIQVGDNPIFYWDQVADLIPGHFLLDVRTKAEADEAAIPGSINIPLDELRSRMAEIPRDRPLYVYCRAGHRAYIAVRILLQQGFREVYNLTGGFLTYAPTRS